MKILHNMMIAIPTLSFSMVSGVYCASAQEEATAIFSGRNIYSPSVVLSHDNNKIEMWYGGWQSQSDYPHDKIYYRYLTNNKKWSSPLPVLIPSDVSRRANHVNDPSVTKTVNDVTKKYQYTMFYTLCIDQCKDNGDNQIWSSVSSDGLKWSFHKPLLTSDGAAVPSAVVNGSKNSVWTIFYSKTQQSPNKIFAVDVSGDRDVLGKERLVFTYPHDGFVANPEVSLISGKWTLLFNVYHTRPGATRRTADIYVVQSDRATWKSGDERPLIVNDPKGEICAALSPALSQISKDEVSIQFAQARYSKKGECDFSTFGSMQETRMTTSQLRGRQVSDTAPAHENARKQGEGTSSLVGLWGLAGLAGFLGLWRRRPG